MEKYTAIARTGTFRDSSGTRRIFTKDDLKKIAENYNASKTNAPLVIGHVKSDSAPAYGWVENLFLKNDTLCATFSYVNEDVKNLVYKGAYKYTSMSVDMENHRLLHIALLGAAAPAIDGLGAINLSGPEENDHIYVFSMENNMEKQEEKSMNEEELKKRIAELEALVLELRTAVEKNKNEKEAAEKAAEQAQAEFSAYLAKQEDEKRQQRIQKLIESGKLEPAKKDEVYAFAAQLAKTSADFSFGTEKMSMEEKYFRDLESRTSQGIFAEFSNMPLHAKDRGFVDPGSMADKL